MTLQRYREKRDFAQTPEPKGGPRTLPGRAFVVQRHAARRLHYDLRLELNGVLKSWAVPRGPSLNPEEKRLAVHVEDHPMAYRHFEGVIPKNEYGAGSVLIWDRGIWIEEGEADDDYRRGHLRFFLLGERLRGRWDLIRMKGAAAGARDNWLLVKANDEFVSGVEAVDVYADSVDSGRTQQEVAAAPEHGRAGERETTPAVEPPSLPEMVVPQLAMLVDEPPAGESWLHEIKFDGYRTLCRVESGRPTLYSRNGQNWTDRFGAIVRALKRLPLHEAWLDGEVAVLQADGTTSFQALQTALSEHRDQSLVYFLFDLLFLDGLDLSHHPLLARKGALASLLASAGTSPMPLRYSEHMLGRGPAFYREACKLSLEGVVSKQTDRPHREGRGREWLKAKCLQRQEFVIGGFTESGGRRSGFGALLLGLFAEDGFHYAGRVGTGFSEKTLRDLYSRLQHLEIPGPPFTRKVPKAAREVLHWVEPRLVAEVAFSNWTEDGVLRQPSYQGLREDKEAREVRREQPEHPPPGAEPEFPSAAPAVRHTVAGLRLTNPGKVLYPGQGLTKRDLAEYYETVQDVMLPDVGNRPLTLLRCPDGRHGECFFQKHVAGPSVPDEIRRIPIEEDGKQATYMAVDSLSGLIGLVQMGVLEIHVWGARVDAPDKPDRLVFDLDPDIGLPWGAVLEGAQVLRERLEELGLVAFVRTTGGKGLHVVAPLLRRHNWIEAKQFAHAVASDVVRANPGAYTARLSKASRRGKIFIDYLRNAWGATAVGNYTTRAKPGAPVAMPLRWGELNSSLRPNLYNVGNIAERLRAVSDPWAGFNDVRQSITKRMKRKVGLE